MTTPIAFMRHMVAILGLVCGAVPAMAQGPTPGFHTALGDCISALQSPDAPVFSGAQDVQGDPVSGMVIWYHGADDTPIYGLRYGTQDGVAICAGPAPMGPYADAYETHDKPLVIQAIRALGMAAINVPVAGDYFADCGADTPSLLLALQPDATQRVGFKFIKSHNVPETCSKFGP